MEILIPVSYCSLEYSSLKLKFYEIEKPNISSILEQERYFLNFN